MASKTAHSAPAPTVTKPASYFMPIVFAIFAVAALYLPAQGASPFVVLIRHTTIMTACAAGVARCLSVIVLHNTGKTTELGYLCTPIGLASGAVTAALILYR
ncbi:hypothetical protein SEUCBS139899_005896 [Sporothrix eucalyptigena]|uniref:Uncharacterized protein n=1 Tax=Sporothrix eucalyptigena TaxID=1812306 RepID=A0ABP0AX54_9PEZI